MRPSDENQHNRMHAHMRPNLMSSSRRGGQEDSILAKLEREPARRTGAGPVARLAWYVAAAVVVLGLTATLVWLAAGTGPATRETARPAMAPPLVGMPAAPVRTAVIVDAEPEPLTEPRPEPLPAPPAAAIAPLRLLEPPVLAPAPVPAAPPLKAGAPQRADARSGAPARTRPQAARQAPRTATRPTRTVNPARTGDAQEDRDVALISAVIYHANGHAAPDEDEAATPPPGR